MKINKTLPDEKAAEVQQAQTFEVLKHLTTLDTGSILLLAGLIEKLFTNPKWKFLVYSALASFTISIFTAVYGMFLVSVSNEEPPSSPDAEYYQTTFAVNMLIALYSFFLGMAIFVVFVIKNF